MSFSYYSSISIINGCCILFYCMLSPVRPCQALIFFSGDIWQGPLCVSVVAADCGLAALSGLHIPPCNKLLVHSPGLAAVGCWLTRVQHTRTLCVSSGSQTSWEEALPLYEEDTTLPRQQETHLLKGCSDVTRPRVLFSHS